MRGKPKFEELESKLENIGDINEENINHNKLYIFDEPMPWEANSTHLIDILLSPLTLIALLNFLIFFLIIM